ncbi:hypothetical protein [uncultured Cedecea sp.]|uniref:transcriptional antitermination N peptide n=1 Tax=uncultured Cedecea sp. TaxID=988762 RepID=UPI00260170A6|nr:hypothetical protein [uncultured Cedecea sp.]
MNAKQRYNAARAAKHREAKAMAKAESKFIMQLLGEPERVMKAVNSTDYKMKPRSKPEQYTGSVCLPEVAIFAAGHRTSRKDAVHIIK